MATDVGGTSELFSENAFIGIMEKPKIESLIDMFNKAYNILNKEITVKIDYGWESVFEKYVALF